ncbi:MAG TPA: YggS family pyridoxal phosphate-dependent enzyme [Casimicrobiaceae bacterium]|nr:YggS family pyridoxal phosphate-dependent enzyme [Casimicrobiaceae bacterium]
MSLDEKAWQAVRARIALAARRAGRDPATVGLLAVSKAQPVAAVRAAYALGQRAFGENYVQEASPKAGLLSDLSDIEWHLIGPLQSNKTRLAAALFAWVQSIDRLKVAERLSAARGARYPPLNVCVQVNISGEQSKSGAMPGDALALARAVSGLPRLALRGFMGIAEETADVERQSRQFRSLRELFDAARADGLALDTLSMGMSADLEAAVAEGATLLRIGTALFGQRTSTTEHA